MKTLTIIFADPNISHPFANKTIVEMLERHYPTAKIRNIYELYPNSKINIAEEQKALLESDVILFQFPLNWFNMPNIMKHWFDSVLNYKFTYGEDAEKLKNKVFLANIAEYGDEEYPTLGMNNFKLEQFFVNLDQSTYFMQMRTSKPDDDVASSIMSIPTVYGSKGFVRERANDQGQRLIKVLDHLLS